MAGTSDDLPIDGIPLDEIERMRAEFHCDEARARLLAAIKLGIPVTGIGQKLTEDYWLGEILKDIEGSSPVLRSRALSLLAQYMGITSDRSAKQKKRRVRIVETPAEIEDTPDAG